MKLMRLGEEVDAPIGVVLAAELMREGEGGRLEDLESIVERLANVVGVMVELLPPAAANKVFNSLTDYYKVTE